MRLVVQRVSTALVKVGGKTVGEIGEGLFVLFGAGQGDTQQDAERLAEKLCKLRVMSDKNDPTSPKASKGRGKMNKTVGDVGGEFLVVSQFTLYADTRKGNRPSFIKAAEPKLANELYECFVEKLETLGGTVKTGSFGAYMDISASLDGPVTILLDTDES